MAQGTFRELQRSGLDMVAVLGQDEDQEQIRSTEPEKASLHSQRTNFSLDSHCSRSSLLPSDNSPDQLPVGSRRYTL